MREPIVILEKPRNRQIVDFLRAIGILSVVLFHVLHPLVRFVDPAEAPRLIARVPAVMNFAWRPLGVDLIFLVSAFLLGLSLIGEYLATGRIDLRAHAVKRLSRILPLCWLAAAASARSC